jgi:hypothetical protein
MTIECYYGTCKYHGSQEEDVGPFCFEHECLASKKELQQFEIIRQEFLRRIECNTPLASTPSPTSSL